MKNLLIISFFTIIFCDDFEYSLEDYNSTSPTYSQNVWHPEYLEFITMHYFSSQGWSGWTGTYGQLSNFQNELRNDDGYENVVIIAVGQSNISSFNNNFTSNSDLPLVMDQYPFLPIREMFSNAGSYGQHKQVVILDYEQNIIGSITLNSGLNTSAKNYIKGILEDHYLQEEFITGDVNGDSIINIQDIIMLVNMILSGQASNAADVNSDGNINILDAIQIVNIILS